MRFAMFFLFFAVAACGNEDAPSSKNQCPPGISVVEGWTKPARKGQPVSAAYLTICNGNKDEAALVAVKNGPTPVASAIEIHQSEMTGGVMSMMQVKRISLPAGEKTIFEPGGAHIMLIGLEQEIADGAAPTLLLEFEGADPILWVLEVRSDEASNGHSHH